MKPSWRSAFFSDVCVKTQTVEPRKWPDRNFTYVDVSSVSNKTFSIEQVSELAGRDAPSRARKRIEAQDVIFATVRPTLMRVAQVPADLHGQVCSTGYVVLRPDGELDARFLYYSLFRSEFREAMEHLQTGASYPAVTDRQVLQQQIPLPPLFEQKRIVAVLDQAFAALDRARAHAEANLADAGALLAEARERLLDSSQDGWCSRQLSELIGIKHGFAFKSEFFSDEGEHVLLTPGNFFEEGGFRSRGAKQKYYTGEVPAGFVLREGDLLMAMTEQAAGLLGSCILVPEGGRFLHNQRLGLIQPRDGVAWHSPYFAHVFNLKGFRGALSSTCTGIKVRHTSPDKIKLASVPVPPSIEIQRSIASELDELTEWTRNLASRYQENLTDLANLRQSLLQKAFSGELT